MKARFLFLFAVLSVACVPPEDVADAGTDDTGYRVGAAKVDITGPFVGSSTGYSSPGDHMAGLAMRLFARTFVIEEDVAQGKRLAIVTADMLHLDQSVKMGVVKALVEDGYGALFDTNNVLMAATHTHAAPSNISWYTLFNLFNGVTGFDALHYRIVVRGIARSIEQAYDARTPAVIKLASGALEGASANRSRTAFERNVDATDDDVDTTMTVLRFDARDGRPLGMLSWFGVHGTSLGIDNRRIHGDNKGYAAYAFETQKGEGFVAAFAQSVFGDVSPNVPDPTDRTLPFKRPSDLDGSLDPLENPIVHGRLQLERARTLYDTASDELRGAVDVRHSHVAYNETRVAREVIGDRRMAWDTDVSAASTCVAALGGGFLAGDEEGAPVDFAGEGEIRNRYVMDGAGYRFEKYSLLELDGAQALLGLLWPVAELALGTGKYDACHKEKFVLLPVGDVRGFWVANPDVPFEPVNLPLQLLRIGGFALAGMPFEVTVMSGRRIEARLRSTLSSVGIDTVVVAGMANGYAQYLTTREEYAAQHFEGAFTAFGPWASAATEQELHRLASDLVAGRPSALGPNPPDLSDEQFVATPVAGSPLPHDAVPVGKNFGDVLVDANATYVAAHDTVQVTFQGTNPRLVQELVDTGELAQYVGSADHTYLEVQRQNGADWEVIARDGDPYTAFDWKDTGGVGAKSSEVTVTWLVRSAEPGSYRIVYRGLARTAQGIQAVTGTSRVFTL